ncbi:hypothetical protein HDE_10803 [Halotydeus destructor]|nr:hypothetical protein HDE_10803 [Halotydeus destructor]
MKYIIVVICLVQLSLEDIVISDGNKVDNSIPQSKPGNHHGGQGLASRIKKILGHYCRKEDIEDNKIEAVQKCLFWRDNLDTELLQKCENEAYGENKTMNQRRTFQCTSRENRRKFKKQFWECYINEARTLEAAGNSGPMNQIIERRTKWKTMSKEERNSLFKQLLMTLADCMETALDLNHQAAVICLCFFIAHTLCCDDEPVPNANVQKLASDALNKSKFGAKMLEVLLKYCGDGKLSADQLMDVEKCSYKRTLIQETVQKCDEEAFGTADLNEKRKIRCFKKKRDESNRLFALCYMRENPESAVEQKLKLDEFSSLTKPEKQRVLKDAFHGYARCVATALKVSL